MQRAQLLLLLVLCTLVAVLHISDLSLQAQQSLTVLSEDGRYELAVVSVNDRQMVPLSDLAKTFALNVREDTLADGLTVTHRDRVVVLTATQGLASVDGRVVSLPSPPVRTSRGWQVPIEFLSRVLGLVIDTPIELRRRSGLVIVGNLHVPEIEVKYTVGRGQAQIAFEMARPAPYTIEEGPRHLFVKFDADALDVSLVRDDYVASYGEAMADWMIGRSRNLCLYPNVYIMDQFSSQIRVFRPLSADKTEVTIYCIAPVGESKENRANRIRQYEDFFNASGMATPDDLEEFRSCNKTYWAKGAQWNDMTRGMEHEIQGPDEQAKALGMDNVLASGVKTEDEGLYPIQHGYWHEVMESGLQAEEAAEAEAAESAAASS